MPMQNQFLRTAIILLLSAALSSHEAAAEEGSKAMGWRQSEIENHKIEIIFKAEGTDNGGKPISTFGNSAETLSFRRNARFYSWRGNCYTQDRDGNWYQVDARLC